MLRGVFGDRKARVITLVRRSKKTVCGNCGTAHYGWYDRAVPRARDLSNGDTRVYLEFEVRRVACQAPHALALHLQGRPRAPLQVQRHTPQRNHPATALDVDQLKNAASPSNKRGS